MFDSSESSTAYEWQQVYLSALVEVDGTKISASIDRAMKIIIERQQNLSPSNPVHYAEVLAISDALSSLRALGRSLEI